ILTLIASDTNAALGTNFIEGIYVYDPQGNELGLLSAFDGTTATAGTYTIKIVLTEAGNDTYTLTPGAKYTFTVKPKAIPVPTLSDIVFNNQFIDLRDYLGGSWTEYQSIIKLGGTYDGVKNVGTYSVTLTLTDENYCWDYGTSASPAKATVKYSLTDNVVWSGDETVASYDWKIAPYVLKASSWNLGGKEGAVYNIPANLTEGLDVDINYLYHTDKTSNPLGDGESLEAGKTYFVKAQLIGADASNFVFEDSNATTSDFATYKIPQSGAAAFMNSVKDFMTKTWLGLPVWAWFLIALALLILLIIIIVVACKRRKSKEEREEIKARKEEERQRREEERQMQREKLEAERELAKAKQEAELEKIRAQAGMGMAGAGMATMAMQQQPQQQPVQQPVQQQPQYQQTDNSVLAEIRAELAEIKARQNMNASYSQPPMQMPMPMPQYMPMQMPMQMPMPQLQNGGSSGGYEDARLMLAEERARTAESRLAEERARAAEEKSYRSMEERAMLAEERFVRGGGTTPAVQQLPAQTMPVNQAAQMPVEMSANPDFIGAVIASALRNSGVSPAPVAAIPQSVEESVQPATVSAHYPSDAVITTTTTVDTTKGKPVMRQREEDTNFDVDGFYDKFE
ncbi:MAG: hypothetical protein K2H30_04220, partial [Clostridia bacterium]|nr:hypothetical protein [Clostridia bacterium]